jgi:hypothetical protein
MGDLFTLPFQRLHAQAPPPQSFADLFGTALIVDVGSHQARTEDGVFGRRSFLEFAIVFRSKNEVVHVIGNIPEHHADVTIPRIWFCTFFVAAKRFSELARFNRVACERHFLGRVGGALFPVVGGAEQELTAETNTSLVAEVVEELKVWLSAAWESNPTFQRLDIVRDFFALPEKVVSYD